MKQSRFTKAYLTAKAPVMLRLLAVYAVTILSCGAVVALEPDQHLSQFAHAVWRIRDGAFSGVPVAITQTTDGYLWVGTPDGLLRFDGVRFVSWSAPPGQSLPRTDIHSLLGSRDGSLWIGTGRGLARWKDGVLSNFPGTGDWVNQILEDKDGAIWIARSQISDGKGPLCRITDKTAECYGQRQSIYEPSASRLVQDTAGNLWVGGFSGLFQWKSGSTKSYFEKEFRQPRTLIGVEALAAQADGSVLASVERTGAPMQLRRFAKGVWNTFDLPGLTGTDSNVSNLFVERNDALWISTGTKGIFRVHGAATDHYGSADGLSSDAVSQVFQDREGTVWVGTSKGIDSFRDLRTISYSIREGLTADSVSTVLSSHDGGVWIGNSGGLDFVKEGRLSAIRERHGFPGRDVTTLMEDHAGFLWIGIDSGLWAYKSGKFRSVRKIDGTALGVIFSLAEDTDHRVWALAGRKLVRVENFRAAEEISSPQVATAFSLAADPRGGLFLGLTNGDLVSFRDGKAITFEGRPFGISSQIRAMLPEPDGSVLAATLRGLVRWKDGTPQVLTALNGLPCDEIYTLLEGDAGEIWLYTRCGLLEISRDEFEKWKGARDHKVALRVYDALDGVQPGLTPLQPQAARSSDGKLWFANDTELQMFDTRRHIRNDIPPPVYIDDIIADRKSYPTREFLRLPPLTRELEIDYAALSYAVPQKVRYRYMLEGHDSEWQDPGNRRQAFYGDLPPGKYRFRVIACNNDGVWNEGGAALTFQLLPMFYQTNSFLALCVVAASSLAWGLYLLRIRQVTRQIQGRLEERLGERERIARELHDTLLQSIQGLILRFQAATEKIPASEPSRQMMEKTLDRADQVLVEGRDRVRNLRVSSEPGIDLPQAFVRAGQEFAEAAPAEFRVVVEGSPRDIHPVVRDEIYWIGHESLANSFTHAHARNIEIEVTYAPSELRLRFRDDGRGISADILSAGGRKGHWGMPGMRERARKIGAQIDTWSGAENGTEVELRVPSGVAYRGDAAKPDTRWLRAFSRKWRAS
jgi:signal transduction histidine kinase/streptogramin lyase